MHLARHTLIAALGLALGAAAALGPGCAPASDGGSHAAAHRETAAAPAPSPALAAHAEAARVESELAEGWRTRIDLTLTHEVAQALSEEVATAAPLLDVHTEDGVVTLRGPVGSDDEQRAAVSAAAAVPGVKRVDDQLRVAAVE